MCELINVLIRMWVIYNPHFVYSLGLASLGNDDACGIKVVTDTAWKKRKLNMILHFMNIRI